MPNNDMARDSIERNPTHPDQPGAARRFTCDRCGMQMVERQCKISCLNCGNRFDCSDLNLYFDDLAPDQREPH
jgi:transcription elongation factor Elf1